MVECSLKIFIDDCSIFGSFFEDCLHCLTLVLVWCKEKNLMLNWEKCHFMVMQDIVLGHVISWWGIEVDKAKVDQIFNLPPPRTVNGVCYFLGHAWFYRWFIHDFSKIVRPMCKSSSPNALLMRTTREHLGTLRAFWCPHLLFSHPTGLYLLRSCVTHRIM